MAEKNLNEIVHNARSLFTRGMEALAHDNFDYAITLLNQVLETEPGFFDCRKALRDAQFRKLGDGGTGFFKKMWSGAGNSPQVAKAKMALNKNPAEAMVIAEQILNSDPNSSAAHRIIVDAGNALELPCTVAMSYETLVKNSPKDKALAIEFARAVSAIGEGTRAARAAQRRRIEDGAQGFVRAQDDGRGRLRRARRRRRLLPRHPEGQEGGRLARTGKARPKIRGPH
jgi:hypothetical protein